MAEASSVPEEELKPSEGTVQRQLNLSAGATIAVAITFLFLAVYASPSISQSVNETPDYSVEWWTTPLDMRHTMDLPMDTLRAQLPENGTYAALP